MAREKTAGAGKGEWGEGGGCGYFKNENKNN